MLKLQSNETPVPIDVELHEGSVGLLLNDSGTGKTFLFSLLRGYCLAQGITCNVIDSSSYTLFSENSPINPCDLLILDSLDLYCKPEFMHKCVKSAKYILGSMKLYPDINDIPWVLCYGDFSDKLLKVRMPVVHAQQ